MPQLLKTPFTEQFGIDFPIIGAPMFLVSTVKLVTAVCEAGGLGSFPALNFRPISKYREAIVDLKAKTKKPFGINIIVQKTNKFQDAQLDIALEERVPLIITSLGNPRDLIRKAHAVGTRVYCDVIGLTHAKKVADAGADGLIAVASGAGGHAGFLSPFALIPLLVREIGLPVVAAGNIVDGAGMAAAFGLGASAVYLGTRFIASREAEVDEEYKQTILRAQCEDIINTDKVDGFPGNFIRTPRLEKLGLQKNILEELASRNSRVRRWIALGRAARSLFGSPQSKASYKTIYSAGQGVGLIHQVEPVKKIVHSMVEEYRQIKAKLP